MGGRKNVILPTLLTVDMSATGSTSAVNVQYLDNIGLELSWPSTGSPNGTITIEGSNSYDAIKNTGSFYSLTFSPTLTQPAGSAGGYLVSLEQFPYAWLRVTYTRSSGGTGATLSAYVTAKEL